VRRKLFVFLPMLGGGGGEQVTITILRHLDRQKFNPSLVLTRLEGVWLEDVPSDVEIHDLGVSRLRHAWRPLLSLLRSERPEVLLSIGWGCNIEAALAQLFLGRTSTRFVHSERSAFSVIRRERRPKWAPVVTVTRLLYRRADRIIAVSQGVSDDLIETLDLDTQKVVWIHNPIVDDRLLELAEQPIDHPWFTDNVPVILAVGRLVSQKDYPVLLRAFARVRQERPARLMILGEGELRSDLEELARQLGVHNDVALPGFLENPFPYMRGCAVYALSSKTEGLPGALIQAMACGAAVVSTDCPHGPSEIIEAGVNGILVPVGDEKAMAAAIGSMLDDPAERMRLSIAARQSAVSNFGVPAMVHRYEQALSSFPGPENHRPSAAAVIKDDLSLSMKTHTRVGLVGCGVISGAHLKAWRKTACMVEGVFDIDRSLAEKKARQFGLHRVYSSVEDLIEHSDIVDVCTPSHTHADIARKAIKAGRHLVIEKPLVTSIEEWEELSGLIQESGVKVAVVHNQKFVNAFQQAKRWIDNGRIGDVIAVSRQFLTNPASDRMLETADHWSHQLRGGRWFETLPHDLYLIYDIAGPLDFMTATVAKGRDVPSKGSTADEVLLTLRNERCIGTIHYSSNCGTNRRMLYIYGSKGIITVDFLSDAAYLSRIKDDKWKRAVGRLFLEGALVLGRMVPDRLGYTYRRLNGETPHAALILAYEKYLEGKGPNPTPLDEIDYVMRNGARIADSIEAELYAPQPFPVGIV